MRGISPGEEKRRLRLERFVEKESLKTGVKEYGERVVIESIEEVLVVGTGVLESDRLA